jgi:hypothetical protein
MTVVGKILESLKKTFKVSEEQFIDHETDIGDDSFKADTAEAKGQTPMDSGSKSEINGLLKQIGAYDPMPHDNPLDDKTIKANTVSAKGQLPGKASAQKDTPAIDTSRA